MNYLLCILGLFVFVFGVCSEMAERNKKETVHWPRKIIGIGDRLKNSLYAQDIIDVNIEFQSFGNDTISSRVGIVPTEELDNIFITADLSMLSKVILRIKMPDGEIVESTYSENKEQ